MCRGSFNFFASESVYVFLKNVCTLKTIPEEANEMKCAGVSGDTKSERGKATLAGTCCLAV